MTLRNNPHRALPPQGKSAPQSQSTQRSIAHCRKAATAPRTLNRRRHSYPLRSLRRFCAVKCFCSAKAFAQGQFTCPCAFSSPTDSKKERHACACLSFLEQGTGVEPASAAWEAAVLPMYEPCGSGLGYHIIFSSKMQPFSGENRKPGLRREARLVISRVLRRREWHRSA